MVATSVAATSAAATGDRRRPRLTLTLRPGEFDGECRGGSYHHDVERRILGFESDEVGDWVAQLDCFHRRHVRHAPPFRMASWVSDADEREQRLGTTLDCGLCDAAELPQGLGVVRTTAEWDEQSVPAALRRAHRVAAGTWGRIRVLDGRLQFRCATIPPIDVVVGAGESQAIPPEVEHEVAPVGSVRFCVDFLRR